MIAPPPSFHCPMLNGTHTVIAGTIDTKQSAVSVVNRVSNVNGEQSTMTSALLPSAIDRVSPFQAFLGFQAPWCILAGGVLGFLLSDTLASLGQAPFFPIEE